VVIDEVGHILTNFHCVYNQNYIRLYYYDEDDWQNYEVNVIGLDPLGDLALIKVLGKEEPIPHLPFAKDAGKIKAGTDVFALGHPMGMAWTVTKGIISSTERYARHPFVKAIQTDSAINKGNSGGPLMNMKGEIVGINALIISKISENAGVGLAIRGDIVKKSFESMLVTGRVDRPAVGIMIMPLAQAKQKNKIIKEFPKLKPKFIPNTFGVFVRPDDNLPKGLKKFDTIIGLNDEMTNDGLQFSDELSKYKIGETVTLTIVRKRRYLTVDVTLKVFPVNADAMYSKIKAPALPKPIKPEKKP
jgi:serine protease Do